MVSRYVPLRSRVCASLSGVRRSLQAFVVQAGKHRHLPMPGCVRRLLRVCFSARVAAAIAHFVAFEVGNVIEPV
jgi:hypothetical protein